VIAWLGFGITPKIGIAALICFFPPFINTLTGLLNVDEDAAEMFRSLGAKKRQIFWSLMLPNAMPIIMAGLKTAISLALIGAIVGEFISASEGMGVLMQRYTFALNMASSFAILVILTIMGYVLFVAMEAIDNWLVFWRHDARMVALSERKRRNFRVD
jgi:NitT/TauT family transport system permease protein